MKNPEFLSIREACQQLPQRPHFNTVRRWMFDGVDGVKLRSVLFGGKRLTSKQWIDEFVEAVQARDPGTSREHQAALATLDEFKV